MDRQILQHPDLRTLYHVWLGLTGDDGQPSTAEIDPAQLRPWLDNLVLIDLSKGEYRYLYYGHNLAEAFGTDMVGRSISDLPEDQRKLLQSEYDRMQQERAPIARRHATEVDGERVTWERLALPFFDIDGTVATVMVAAYRL